MSTKQFARFIVPSRYQVEKWSRADGDVECTDIVARVEIEGVIPKHLLYVKGWPTVMPTQAEAELLAEVRCEIGRVMRLDVRYTEANEVLGRYAELMALKESKGKS